MRRCNFLENGGLILSDAVRDWLTDFKTQSVKAATYDRLETSLKLMKRYPISNLFVDQLQTRNIQQYINQLVSDGYSKSTIKKQKTLLTAYLKFAYSQGIVSKAAYIGVVLPTKSAIKKPERKIAVYTEREQALLVRTFKTLYNPAYGIAILLLEEGLRIGEALALSWNDIMWGRKAISITKTTVRLGQKRVTFVQDGAKSASSNRLIPMSSLAYSVLKELLSCEPDTSGLIFHQPNQPFSPITYDSVRYQIKSVCEKNDIPYYGLHAFRHTFATNCFKRGCNVKILSKLLGHADVSITYNIYIHLYGDALEEMRSVFG